MKEELQGKLVEILTSIQGAVGKASDFAMEQIPDVAMQYLMFGRITNTIEAVVLTSVFVILLYYWIKLVKYCLKEGQEGDAIGFGLFGGGGLVLFFLLTFCSIKEAILPWVAPKVWLIKEIAGMVK